MISVTPRCNFHCIYCDPLGASHTEPIGVLTVEDVDHFVQAAAHAADLERKQRLLERRQRQGLVTAKDRALTREEQEARIWAFMCDDLADLIITKIWF